jgi:hypothetical protein
VTYCSVPKLSVIHFIFPNADVLIHKTLILPVLCGYERLSLTLTNINYKCFENKVLRKIFGSVRNEAKWIIRVFILQNVIYTGDLALLG